MDAALPCQTSRMQGDSLARLRSGTVEFCVLALLRHRPMSVLELRRALVETRGLLADDRAIYPLLARLRRSGFVDSEWVDSLTGPRRRYHTITREGRVALDEFLSEWQIFRASVDRVLSAG